MHPGKERCTIDLQQLINNLLQVTRSALNNACGIAGIMLTTQAVMVEKKTKGAAAGAAANPMGMGAGGMPAGMTM